MCGSSNLFHFIPFIYSSAHKLIFFKTFSIEVFSKPDPHSTACVKVFILFIWPSRTMGDVNCCVFCIIMKNKVTRKNHGKINQNEAWINDLLNGICSFRAFLWVVKNRTCTNSTRLHWWDKINIYTGFERYLVAWINFITSCWVTYTRLWDCWKEVFGFTTLIMFWWNTNNTSQYVTLQYYHGWCIYFSLTHWPEQQF